MAHPSFEGIIDKKQLKKELRIKLERIYQMKLDTRGEIVQVQDDAKYNPKLNENLPKLERTLHALEAEEGEVRDELAALESVI